MESSLLNYKLEIESSDTERRPDPFESSMMNFDPRASSANPGDDIADREAWRAFIPSLLQVSYKLACRRIWSFSLVITALNRPSGFRAMVQNSKLSQLSVNPRINR
jgi:hypothetical protein